MDPLLKPSQAVSVTVKLTETIALCIERLYDEEPIRISCLRIPSLFLRDPEREFYLREVASHTGVISSPLHTVA